MKRFLMILIASFTFTAQALAGVAAPNLTSINMIHNPAAEGLKVSSGEIHLTNMELSSSERPLSIGVFRWDWGFVGYQLFSWNGDYQDIKFVGYRKDGLSIALYFGDSAIRSVSENLSSNSVSGLSCSWEASQNFVIGLAYTSNNRVSAYVDNDPNNLIYGLTYTEPNLYNLAYDGKSYIDALENIISGGNITLERQFGDFILGFNFDDQFTLEAITQTNLYVAYEPESGLIAKLGIEELDDGLINGTGSNLSVGNKF